MDSFERYKNYSENHCWQYNIRVNNLETDLNEAGLSPEDVKDITVNDFEFRVIDPDDNTEKQKVVSFIKRHEWLGTISIYTTHWFGAYYRDMLAGVILMGMPNSFSSLLGKDTKRIERLINRGACISWSPKNLASNLLMQSIRWMVKNTQYRLFTCYSDPEAKELGTIYQACNFTYLGQSSGGIKKYVNPYNGKWISDRVFRARSFYKKYAQELGIEWDREWNRDSKMIWDNIPDDVELKLREMSRKKQSEAEYRIMQPKHKYALILGSNKKETRMLKQKFQTLNPRLVGLQYPKER